jgi:hypothetical protein
MQLFLLEIINKLKLEKNNHIYSENLFWCRFMKILIVINVNYFGIALNAPIITRR